MNEITGHTKLYVIIGDPIAQVLSPTLFNAAFKAQGMDAVLVPYQVSSVDLASAMHGLRSVRNLGGIIITVPHKIAVTKFVDHMGPAGACIGAINAIRVEADGSWIGDNFDGAGCVSALFAAGHSLEKRDALIIGAGGAGSSVAFALARAGVSSITLHDPDEAQTIRLISRLAEHVPSVRVLSGSNSPAGKGIIVNCTPLGMKEGDPLPVDVAAIESTAIVVDVILKPEVSPMIKLARTRGLATQIGRLMLEGQVNAVLDFLRSRS